jgi:hypothetical protein
MPASTSEKGVLYRTSVLIKRSQKLCETTDRLIEQSNELIEHNQALKSELMRRMRSLDPALYPATAHLASAWGRVRLEA